MFYGTCKYSLKVFNGYKQTTWDIYQWVFVPDLERLYVVFKKLTITDMPKSCLNHIHKIKKCFIVQTQNLMMYRRHLTVWENLPCQCWEPKTLHSKVRSHQLFSICNFDRHISKFFFIKNLFIFIVSVTEFTWEIHHINKQMKFCQNISSL